MLVYTRNQTTICLYSPISSSSDDIILTQLNPTEEYKSSVLAGLKPDIILDVCSRAIAFYEYQTSQELAFRSILQKNTEEKYNTLKSRFDLVTRDISHVLKVEKEKHKAISSDYQLEKKRSQQIYKKYEEKTKQFQKLKVMYERLKRRSIAPNIQESFSALQPVPPQQTISNNGNHIMSFHNQNTHLQQQQHHQPATPSMVFDVDNDDVLSRIDRSSTVARSVFMPPNPRQQGSIYTDHSKPQQLHARPYSPSRIPSPVKSTFSVRSSHQKIYKKPSGTNKTKQPQENSEHHQLRHHPKRSSVAPSEP